MPSSIGGAGSSGPSLKDGQFFCGVWRGRLSRGGRGNRVPCLAFGFWSFVCGTISFLRLRVFLCALQTYCTFFVLGVGILCLSFFLRLFFLTFVCPASLKKRLSLSYMNCLFGAQVSLKELSFQLVVCITPGRAIMGMFSGSQLSQERRPFGASAGLYDTLSKQLEQRLFMRIVAPVSTNK